MAGPCRILHVTRETAGDRRFGIGRSLLPVTEALRARGHEVRYLTQEDLSPRALSALPRLAAAMAHPLRWSTGMRDPLVALAFAERLNIGRVAALMARREGYTHVHLHDPWMAWAYRRACWVHRARPGTVWGLTQHGFGSYAQATQEEGFPTSPRLWRALCAVERSVCGQAGFVLCPTAAGRAQLARDLGYRKPPRHWWAIPHARPTLGLPSREQARSALGWPAGQAVIVAVGRINPVKRLEQVVQACLRLLGTPALERSAHPLRLVLLAAGGDPAPLQAMAALEPRLQLQIQLAEDVAPFLAASDVYVSAALNESFGLANLEAMTAGLAMVCTAVGGVPEVTGGAAWLVPGDDHPELPHRLAQALETLLPDPGLRRGWADRAALRATAWPDATQVAQRYEEMYGIR